jgi:hypothetical protein
MKESEDERKKREEIEKRKKIEALRPMSRLEFQILYGKCASSGWVYGESNETLYQQYIQRYGFFLSHLTLLKKDREIFEDVLLTQLPDKDIFFLVDKSGLIHTISLPGTKAAKAANESKNEEVNAANINWFFAESPNTLETYVYNPDKNAETAYYTGPLTILKTAALTAALPEVLSASKLTLKELKLSVIAAKKAAKKVTQIVNNTKAAVAKTELAVALNNVEELTLALTVAAATLEEATGLATEAEVAAVAKSAAAAAATVEVALETELITETAATVLAALKDAVLLVQTTTQKKNWIDQNIILLDFFPFPIIMSTDVRKDVFKEGYTFRAHLSEYFKPLVENVKKLFAEPASVNVYLIAPTYTSVHAILELTDFDWAELVTLKASSTYKQSIEKRPFGFDTKKTPKKIYDGHLEIRGNEFDEFKKKFKLETSVYYLNDEIPSVNTDYPDFCAYLKKRIYLNDGNFPGIPGEDE